MQMYKLINLPNNHNIKHSKGGPDSQISFEEG